MEIDFARGAALCKAMADDTRVRIVHILSCGELCACDIHGYFDLTQPTLSHHLNVLVDSGLVLARPEGKWTYYRLDKSAFSFLERLVKDVSRKSGTCLCRKKGRICE